MSAVAFLLFWAVVTPVGSSGPGSPVPTYEEASCVTADAGECAVDPLMDFSSVPLAIFVCPSPVPVEMIEWCYLPAPAIPSMHFPTLKRAGSAFAVTARSNSPDRFTVDRAPPAVDAAILLARVAFAPPPYSYLVSALVPTSVKHVPPSRLDRPPRV
jgi:hypothetical protein